MNKQQEKLDKMKELRVRLVNKEDTLGIIMINTIIRLEQEQNKQRNKLLSKRM